MNRKLARLWATKNKDDEWWSSFVTAPTAIMLNYLVVDVNALTPNRVTLCSFIVAILSVIFIVAGGSFNFIVAAVLIHLSHILDCMDGQMSRYRQSSSKSGCYFDKLTDQIQVSLWFCAISYAAYLQSHHILPIFLAFIGVNFYNLRGYSKYVLFHTNVCADSKYLEKTTSEEKRLKKEDTAGLEFGLVANLKWFVCEQRKFFAFDEGVFIFMLSLALIVDKITPMLWIFAVSQVFYGLFRGCQRGYNLCHGKNVIIKK